MTVLLLLGCTAGGSLPENTELVPLLPFSPVRKRTRFEFEQFDGTHSEVGPAAQRAKLPGCLPAAAAAVRVRAC